MLGALSPALGKLAGCNCGSFQLLLMSIPTSFQLAPSPLGLYGTYYHYSGLGCELGVLQAILSTGAAPAARGCSTPPSIPDATALPLFRS